ncbi:hypothetical protein DL546_006154 [Coniochaeta pulveracea]|uniref:YDG domain-containing protein n=1 Tax=Coniochaeta pulveracea TaxID=177199 RepID=A0A420Y7P6_9PEZI|nr:hypothetical protein DL546_006154 [Coniochaeta pulveracea]
MSAPAPNLGLIDKPNDHTTLDIVKEGVRKAKFMALKYKKANGQPQMTAEIQGYLDYMAKFLPWLNGQTMTATIVAQSGGIQRTLEILGDPSFHLPHDIATQARSIYIRFNSANWGALPPASGSATNAASNATAPVPSAPATTAATTAQTDSGAVTKVVTTRPPPANHPIFGVNGIMHGFMLQKTVTTSLATGTRTISKRSVVNPAYAHLKRDFKVFGHNGHAPGAWWPNQFVALFHGAHGASQAGISGSADIGAWSVVVSGHYADMDNDQGETIMYSGDSSLDNRDPNHLPPASALTQSLIKSHQTQRNPAGGLYRKFRLRRDAGQRPLAQINQVVPTHQQRRDFNRILEYY